MTSAVQASNILLDRGNVLLGDFGIAAHMERCLSNCKKGEFGRYLARSSFVGTPVWMAPEVIEQSCGYVLALPSSLMHHFARHVVLKDIYLSFSNLSRMM